MGRITSCVVLAGLVAVGCKKESANQAGGMGGEPIAAASTDPLWAFAPPGASVGVVVADGALEPLYRGGLTALAALEKAPGGAEIAGKIRSQARTPVGDVLDRATLEGFGVDLKKGMAFFEAESVRVAVLPIGDPAKLAGKLGVPIDKGVVQLGPMSCKDVSGRFVCADSPAALDAAKGGGASPVASWPREMRGHVEVFVSAERMKDSDIPLAEPGGLRASAVLERGAMTARVHLLGKPEGPLAAAKSGKSSLVSGVADLQPTGIFLVNAAGLWKLALARSGGAPDQPLPGGVSAKELVAAPSGEVLGFALPGLPLRGLLRIGLADPAPVKKLIAACGEFAAMAPPGVTIKKNGEKCSLSVDPAALGAPSPAIGSLSVDAWVEASTLVVGAGQYTATSRVRPGLAPFAREILAGSWLVAAWGQGTIAGMEPAELAEMQANMQAAIKAEPMLGLGSWAFYHLSEFGVAGRVADDGIHGLLRVRTLWANPDELVIAVEEKFAAMAAGDTSAAAAIAALAKKHPGSPFARDLEAGAGGLMAPVGVAGILAAVSIPAFMKYQKKSETTEARSHLHKLYDGAREHWMDPPPPAGGIQAAPPRFPAPSAGPTPPLGTCCQQGGTCQPDPALWAGEPWRSLKFSLDDPHYYSYEYKVQAGKPGATDGSHNFTVLAYGDLDCDGQYSTFSMYGEVNQANADGPSGTAALHRVDELE